MAFGSSESLCHPQNLPQALQEIELVVNMVQAKLE